MVSFDKAQLKKNLILKRNGFSTEDLIKLNALYPCSTTGGGGTGTGTGGGSCTDSNNNCSYWAGAGECTKNPGWMLENCKKSCNNCKCLFITLEVFEKYYLDCTSATVKRGIRYKNEL